MVKEFSPALNATVERDTVYPIMAVELDFDTEPLYLWSGVGSLKHDGKTYTGAGDLLGISSVQEGADVEASGATLTLSGIPTNLINLALEESYQGRRARVKFGFVDAQAADLGFLQKEDGSYLLKEDGDKFDISYDTSTLLFSLFSGYMDKINVELAADTLTIALAIESKMIDLERPRVRRYTDLDQRAHFPGDRAFEFVDRMQSESLKFGKA